MRLENGIIMMVVSILPHAELDQTNHRETHPTLGLYQDPRSQIHINLANSKRDALNDEPPSYDSIDFTKNEHELPTYDDIRNLQ